ncbi:hypothetical protein FACS1894211_10590 [Clostridia bacterium]|nr:hypothetical protein FACS1894211_10590 [Clostridia bacterium]
MTEAKIKQIRRLFTEEHLAAEQIAARLGYGISTVYKYLRTENDAVSAAPKDKKPHLIDPFIPVIREWLIEDKSVYFKQRHIEPSDLALSYTIKRLKETAKAHPKLRLATMECTIGLSGYGKVKSIYRKASEQIVSRTNDMGG